MFDSIGATRLDRHESPEHPTMKRVLLEMQKIKIAPLNPTEDIIEEISKGYVEIAGTRVRITGETTREEFIREYGEKFNPYHAELFDLSCPSFIRFFRFEVD